MLKVLLALIIAFCSIDAMAFDDVWRVTSFPNSVIYVEARITPTSRQFIRELNLNSCLGPTCADKFNLSADLTVIDGRIKDFALNRTEESAGPVKYSVVCTYLVPTPDNLTAPDQHSGIFQTGLQHEGINSFHVIQGTDNRVRAAYFRKTSNPEIIAHALANVNKTNCNTTGPSVVLYPVPKDEFQTSPKTYDRLVGAILKNSDGFEFYYADVFTREVGETRLNIPGGQSVNVISAALAIGPTAISPGKAGIPTNELDQECGY